ncbi:MAG: C4-type zinc ribbon domain-containing protein [Thermodesulfobacteriota bacterium]
MSLYLKQIEQLVVLQRVDNEILLLEKDLDEAPREVTVLEEQNAALAEQANQLNEKIELLKSQQKRLDAEIEDNEMKIKKSKNKLMMVQNTREHQAMVREMDSLEKINRTREEEQVALAEELARQDETRREMDARTSTLLTDLEEKRSSLDKRMADAQKRLSALGSKRKTACGVVPPPILGRYEFIRSRISNPVIVPVDSGVCGGCHISIPPQIFNDLQKGTQIISCPNCQRLIYWCEHFTEQDAAACLNV